MANSSRGKGVSRFTLVGEFSRILLCFLLEYWSGGVLAIADCRFRISDFGFRIEVSSSLNLKKNLKSQIIICTTW